MYCRCLNFDSLALGFYPDAGFFKNVTNGRKGSVLHVNLIFRHYSDMYHHLHTYFGYGLPGYQDIVQFPGYDTSMYTGCNFFIGTEVHT